MEGSWSGSRSRRPKNIRIRRIRIRNTCLVSVYHSHCFFYLQPNSEQAEEPERVHLAALIGVGEEEGAEAPGREYGEGRHEGGRGGRAQVVKAHTLKGLSK